MDKQKLYTLKNDRAEALEAAAAALDAGKMEEHQAEMERVKGFNAQIEAVERLLGEQERFGQDPGQSQAVPARTATPRPSRPLPRRPGRASG